jgi:hypothetical protein
MRRKHKGLMGEVNLLGLDQFGQNPGMSPITGALIGGGVANLTALAVGNMAMFQVPLTPTGTPPAQNRHFWGFAAGLLSAGILWLSGPERARHASWGALVGAGLAEGLPWLEKMLLGYVEVPATTAATAAAVVATAPAVAAAAQQATATGTPATVTVTVPPAGTPAVAAAAGTSGFGLHQMHALNGRGLGMRRQAGGQYLNGLGIPRVQAMNGLGLATVAPQPQSVGTIPGVAGPAFAGTQMGAAMPVNAVGAATSQSRQVQLLGGPQIHGLSAAYGATLLGGGRG